MESSSMQDRPSVCVTLTRPPSTGGSNNHGSTAWVVVWAWHPSTTNLLEYYAFSDSSRWFPHLDRLLTTRLAPMRELIVATQPQQQKQQQSAAQKLQLAWHKSIQQFLESRSDLLTSHPEDSEMEEDGSYINAAIQWVMAPHSGKASSARSDMEGQLDALLVPDEAVRLAYKANVDLWADPSLALGWSVWRQHCTDFCSASHPLIANIRPGRLWEAQCLHVDRTAAQALLVWPEASSSSTQNLQSSSSSNSSQTSSLWGLLSRPLRTKMGGAVLDLWLRHPLIDVTQISERQEAVATLVEAPAAFAAIYREALPQFAGTDLTAVARYWQSVASDDDQSMSGQAARVAPSTVDSQKTLQSLYRLYLLAHQQMPALVDALEQAVEGSNSNLLKDYHQQAKTMANQLLPVIELTEQVLDLEQAPRDFFLKSRFDEALHDLERELSETQRQVDDHQDQVQSLWEATGHALSHLTIRLEVVEEAGSPRKWQFRLPNAHAAKHLQEHMSKKNSSFPPVQIHRILKNGVFFSTKTLRQLSHAAQELRQQYTAHSKHVIADLAPVAASYAGVVLQASSLVANLDALAALAHLVLHSPTTYCRPTLTDIDPSSSSSTEAAKISLKQARHPCVELQEHVVDYIPNDIELQLKSRSDAGSTIPNSAAPFLLVTGPNAGGKSTVLKSVGAIVVLAQMGCWVPCTEATINICHSIEARVGAGDWQTRGISTFLAEMLEASHICQAATQRSLVLVDELGRGTSTFDGYGLARAISEYLLEHIGCFVVMATHFHELTSALEPAGICNVHVTAIPVPPPLTFPYTLHPGPCLKSFGIAVAELAQVPSVVVADAREKASQLEGCTSSSSSSNANVGQDSPTVFLERFRQLDLPAILAQHGYPASSMEVEDEKESDGLPNEAALVQALRSALLE